MSRLICNEFQRYFMKKSWFGLLLSIPFMVALMALQSMKANQLLSVERQTTFHTFALYTPMHKVFTFYIFAVVTFLVVNSIATEYESSEIRMILIRGYSAKQVFFVKLLVILIALFIFLLCYVGGAYLIGNFVFSHQSTVTSFLNFHELTAEAAFLMTMKYYGFLFVILMAFALIVAFVAMLSRSVMTTTVIALGIIVVSFGFYMVTQFLQTYISGIDANQLNMLALPLMQLKGLYQS